MPRTTAWDELFDRTGVPHAHCAQLVERLGKLRHSEFQSMRGNADLAFVNQGITFSVYSDRRGVEKIFPFDLIPRTIPSGEWATLETGLVQRRAGAQLVPSRRLPRPTNLARRG